MRSVGDRRASHGVGSTAADPAGGVVRVAVAMVHWAALDAQPATGSGWRGLLTPPCRTRIAIAVALVLLDGVANQAVRAGRDRRPDSCMPLVK